MTRQEVVNKLKHFFFLAPIKVVRDDGAEFGVLIPRNIVIENDGISFDNDGERQEIPLEQVRDIVPLAKAMVRSWN
jgi:hypothetical protein